MAYDRQRQSLEQSQISFASASDASFIVLDFTAIKHKTTPFVLTQLFSLMKVNKSEAYIGMLSS
jgi:hypothetical protein